MKLIESIGLVYYFSSPTSSSFFFRFHIAFLVRHIFCVVPVYSCMLFRILNWVINMLQKEGISACGTLYRYHSNNNKRENIHIYSLSLFIPIIYYYTIAIHIQCVCVSVHFCVWALCFLPFSNASEKSIFHTYRMKNSHNLLARNDS